MRGERPAIAVLVLLWLLLGVSPAPAQTLDPIADGALVFLPYLTSDIGAGRRVSLATIERTDFGPRWNLHLTWIRGSDWTATDFDCPLEALQTASFRFEAGASPGSVTVTFLCSGDSPWSPVEYVRSVGGPDGILAVALELTTGPTQARTLQANALLGEAIVQTALPGVTATMPGIHVQGVAGAPGDRLYRFDASPGEYRRFPALLTEAFAAPASDTSVELVLFTPDGRISGGPGIQARLNGFVFDADDQPISGSIAFDCFTRLDFGATLLGQNLRRETTGGLTGRFELAPAIVARTDPHDLTPPAGSFPGGGRRAPVHGWIIETFAGAPDVNLPMGVSVPAPPCTTPCALGREIGQDVTPLLPLGADVPSLDAR